MSQLRRLPLLFAATLAAVLAVAGPAAADSIVYVSQGNVWLTSPDGARQYQVTFDGGWDSPSQADDGTIVAAKGQLLVRMDRSGRVIGTPVPGLGGATGTIPGERFKLFGPFDPEVSPDGRRIAYWATAYNPSSTGEVVYTDWRDVSLVTPSDRFEMPRANWITSVKQPSWIGSDRLMVTGSGLTNMNFETWMPGIGDDHLQWWFRYVNAIETDHELSRDGRKLVAVAQTNGALSAPDTLHYFAVPGPAWTAPPYPNTWMDDAPRPPAGEPRCENVRDSIAHNPSWAPSSTAVAFDDKDGIWVQQVGDLPADCSGMSEKLLVPGGAHPDWGPADVDLAHKPAGPGTGAGTPGPGAPSGPGGPGTGAGNPGPGAPAGPGGPASPLRRLTIPKHATRRSGVTVKVLLARPARVAVTVCRRARAACRGRAVTRTVAARAGTTRIAVSLKRLRAGRYTVVVSVAGAEPVSRALTVR